MKVLFVCLGNICRSPTAEGVARHLGLREVDSAGTAGYHIGDPPDPRTQRAAHARGIDLSGLRARQIERRDFDRFDLILAMDSKILPRWKKFALRSAWPNYGCFSTLRRSWACGTCRIRTTAGPGL